jgi:hypothetical protein
MKTKEEFFKFLRKECKTHGVELSLRKTGYVKLSGFKCGGYFDCDSTPKPKLVCAMNKSSSISTLVHEYCHMTQWLDKIPLWGMAGISNYIMGEWLNGVEYSDIANHIAIVRNLELDNEIRASEMIEDYDLGVTKSEYIKTANAYIVYYNYLLISRKWSKPQNSPYCNKKIVAAMSDKFDMNYQSLDRDLYDLFKSENI